MDTEFDEIASRKKIENVTQAKEQWLCGYIDDDQLISALRSEPSYRVLQKHGLAEAFDELSQVNCVREMLEECPLGGDTTETVRRYAMECWDRKDECDDMARMLFGFD